MNKIRLYAVFVLNFCFRKKSISVIKISSRLTPVVAVTFGYTDRPVSELGPDRVIEHFSQLPEAVVALVTVDVA